MTDELEIQEIDKYAIINKLGAGHFGAVYLAQDRALDCRKAIKVLNIKDPKSFMNELEEAQILNKLKHKHIVAINEANIFDVNSTPKVVIDMELIEGGSLEDKLLGEHVTAIESVGYCINILFALEHSHGQNILHRDIKPANIMLNGNAAKLSDFGLATSVAGNYAGSPKGYITHLAPETFSKGETTKLTDIFSVGITLYRTLCNITNWRERIASLPNLENEIRKGSLIKVMGYPTYVPSKLKRVVSKACSPDPTKRYQSAREMRQALEKLELFISWKMTSDFDWVGDCKKTGSKFDINVKQKRSGAEFVIKKNNRKVGQQCKTFQSLEEASQYASLWVSNNALA